LTRAVAVLSFFFFIAAPGHLRVVSAEIASIEEPEVCQEPEALKYFRSDKAREHLISRIYRAGAVYVGVLFINEDPAGLKVYLPENVDLRPEIFRIANETLIQSGFASEEDAGQAGVTIWLKY
jgi:hypothetical protein